MLVIAYSGNARQNLEALLARDGAEIAVVDGRAPDAAEAVRKSGAAVVVLDSSARDVNLAQAIRQLGQLLPGSMVLTVCPDQERVAIYRDGHKIREAASLGAALRAKPAEREEPAQPIQ